MQSTRFVHSQNITQNSVIDFTERVHFDTAWAVVPLCHGVGVVGDVVHGPVGDHVHATLVAGGLAGVPRTKEASFVFVLREIYL